MKTIKIFLASSEELKTDREQFEIFVGRQNQKLLSEKDIFLELILWENFLDTMALKGLQEEYNRAAAEADIFILLFSLKVGDYSAEEFESAYKTFTLNGLPKVLTYFKKVSVSNDEWGERDFSSQKRFLDKLHELKHYPTKYEHSDKLGSHFKDQLEKLLKAGFLEKISRKRSRVEISRQGDYVNEVNDAGASRTDQGGVFTIKNHNLPYRTYGPKLIGREKYIQKVLKGICEAPIVTIEGFSGIGKTSLALEIAYMFLGNPEIKLKLGLQFDYLVWFSAKNKEQKHLLNDVLNKIGEVLGHPSIGQVPPEQLSVKKKEIELLLSQPEKKLFLVIDNFETIVDPALNDWLVTHFEPTKILITSQKKEFDFWHVNLGRLDNDEALALIRKYAEKEDLNHLSSVPDEKLLGLVEITSGNPLAIRLAIGQISSGTLSLEQVVDNLKENNPTASIDIVFDKIHQTSWVNIGPNAQQLLLVVPLFTGTESIEKNALQATSGLAETEYEKATQTLLTWKLLEPNFEDTSRFVIHSMTRRFVKRKLGQQSDFEGKARKLWYKYYLKFISNHVIRENPPVKYWNALVNHRMQNVDFEWPTIFEVMKWSTRDVSTENDRLLLNLILLLVHYMDSRFYNIERIKYVGLAIGAANRLERKYEEALLRIDALGWTYVEENKYDDAYTEINKGIELAEKVKGSDIQTNELLALGSAWVARVKIEQDRSRLVDEAGELIELALKFNDHSQPWIRLRILMAAGDIFLKQNQSKEALEKFLDAKNEMIKYGGEGNYYQINPRIGLAHLALNSLSEAEKIFDALSSQNTISIGKLYGDYGLALIRFKKGDTKEANLLLHNVKAELSKRTSSNLLLKLINEFEETLKR